MPRIFSLSWLPLALVACGESGNSSAAFPLADSPATTEIFEIQGNGNTSPMQNQRVTVVGVVTGDFQDDDRDDSRNLGGFFFQAITSDSDPETSDGIFVFDRNATSVDVAPGQKVEVSGAVTERFGETQIVARTVVVTGSGVVPVTDIAFPIGTTINSDGDVIADLERFEGMLVELPEPATVSDVFDLERYGEITLSMRGRLMQFTNANSPNVEGYASHVETSASNSIVLDDGLAIRNPSTYRFVKPNSPGNSAHSVRAGNLASGVIGNIRFSRGSGASGTESYRLVPTGDPVIRSHVASRAIPPSVGGAISVASFNVLNYFTTIDRGQKNCGPARNADCRGADSNAEFDRQHAKIVNTLLTLDADLVGLMELENNGGAALQSLIDALNRRLGTAAWNFIDTGTIGTDAIAVGIIYRATTVQPMGSFSLLTSAIDAKFNDQKNRPALAQTFQSVANGGRFTVAVTHLKSKGSPCDDVDDPNLSDGQANCNRTRTEAALALANWLDGDPTDSGDSDVLIIGDLNAYLQEDPVTALEDAGYVNLLEEFIEVEPYSFVFDGQSGALDHAFASPSLFDRITGVAEWHINADEPPLFDYNLEFDRDAGLFDASSPFRTSDHDPVIIGIDP